MCLGFRRLKRVRPYHAHTRVRAGTAKAPLFFHMHFQCQAANVRGLLFLHAAPVAGIKLNVVNGIACLSHVSEHRHRSEENIFSQADPICSVPARSYTLLGGSWDLVRKVISTLIGVISSYKYTCRFVRGQYSSRCRSCMFFVGTA